MSLPSHGRSFCTRLKAMHLSRQQSEGVWGRVNTLTSHCHQPKDKGCKYDSA